jgi:hypothetical protein
VVVAPTPHADAETVNAQNRRASRRLWGLLLAAAVFYLGCFAFFPRQFFPLGVNHPTVWFMDSYAILASNDALALGRDVYSPNPLDYFGRPHVYSHWWLVLGKVGLSRADNRWIGLVLGIAFVAAAVARLRPREPREILWYLLVLCASSTLVALDRANNDLVVFLLLAPVVPCLLAERRWLRFVPVFLIAVATGLKFYPACAALVLLTGLDRRETRVRVTVALFALVAIGLNVSGDLVRVGPILPKAEGLMTFASAKLIGLLGLTGWGALGFGCGLAGLIIGAFWRSSLFDRWEIAQDSRADWLSFVLGAVLLAGCFFAGTNYPYRWVFAIWLAPLLWRLPRDKRVPAAVRRLAAATAGLCLFALWFDPLASGVLNGLVGRYPVETIIRWADRLLLIEQPVIWAFFVCLLGFLSHFARCGLRQLGRERS